MRARIERAFLNDVGAIALDNAALPVDRGMTSIRHVDSRSPVAAGELLSPFLNKSYSNYN